MKETIETDFIIPIEVINVPKNILITSDLPNSLSVDVKDKGATIFSYFFSRTLPVFKIDFSQLKSDHGEISITSDMIVAQLHKKLVPTIEVVSVFPESLTLNFSRGESKVLPISLISAITAASSCGLSGQLNISPIYVTAYGPKKKLNELTKIYSETLILQNLKDSVTTTVQLQKIDGIRFIPQKVKVTVPVEPFTEKKLDVTIESNNAPAGYVMRIFPVKVNLVCYVALSKYNKVQPTDFQLGIDSTMSSNKTSLKYRVKLLKAPSFVSKIRFQPEEVEVLMEERR
ncbi:MAG: YbbR-like domain-containing protein [Bacteroidales bacterium]|nr:YbbR-like domain-containing protein [Bacteroidales bacterium]